MSSLRTALVLSGGGPVGIAWEAGMLAGLREGGLDLAEVDCVIGTSAGSIVGAHLALLGSVDMLYARQSVALDGLDAPPDFMRLMLIVQAARLLHRNTDAQNRAIASNSRGIDAGSEERWLRTIAETLPDEAHVRWPERELWITATDCESGALTVWRRESEVPLPLAVASSCAVPVFYPRVHIQGRTYMDGGMGSPANAGLAQGFERVVILDAMARLLGRQGPLEREIEDLQRGGSHVLSFTFDDRSAKLGANLMDIAARGPVAEAGRRQAGEWLAANAREADELRAQLGPRAR